MKTFNLKKIYNKKIYIAPADKLHPELGTGLFANRAIKKGEVLFIIKGKRMPLKINSKADSALLPNAISIDESVWLDPRPDNALVFLNHSCNPNTGIKGSLNIVALRNIKKDEHVTIDYSITEWDKLWSLDKICKCGSKDCRKVIRSVQHLPPQIYNRYLPFVPKFLQKVYLRDR